MRKGFHVLLSSTLLFAAGGTAAPYTYYPPVDRLVLNELVPLAGPASFPFYLPKRGQYYAEILREAGPDPTAAQALDVTVRVMRDTTVVFEKRVQHVLPADANGATLFWLNAPYDVPDRRGLTVTVATNAPLSTPLRLQITRKVELLPLSLR